MSWCRPGERRSACPLPCLGGGDGAAAHLYPRGRVCARPAAARSPSPGHQLTTPCRSVKVPVGPSWAMVAMATTASVPSVTVCGPEFPLSSVAV